MNEFDGGIVCGIGMVSFVDKNMEGKMRMFVMGGDQESSNTSPELYEYNSDTDSWSLQRNTYSTQHFSYVSPLAFNL